MWGLAIVGLTYLSTINAGIYCSTFVPLLAAFAFVICLHGALKEPRE